MYILERIVQIYALHCCILKNCLKLCKSLMGCIYFLHIFVQRNVGLNDIFCKCCMRIKDTWQNNYNVTVYYSFNCVLDDKKHTFILL